MAAMLSIRNAV